MRTAVSTKFVLEQRYKPLTSCIYLLKRRVQLDLLISSLHIVLVTNYLYSSLIMKSTTKSSISQYSLQSSLLLLYLFSISYFIIVSAEIFQLIGFSINNLWKNWSIKRSKQKKVESKAKIYLWFLNINGISISWSMYSSLWAETSWQKDNKSCLYFINDCK